MIDVATLTTQLQHVLQADPRLKEALQGQQETPQIVAALTDAARRHGLPLDGGVLQQALDVTRKIRALVQDDPALMQELLSASSARQASELIERVARAKGLSVDGHGQSEGARMRELGDTELELAVGGGSDPFGVFKVLSSLISSVNQGVADIASMSAMLNNQVAADVASIRAMLNKSP